jgi:hypothetical protein
MFKPTTITWVLVVFGAITNIPLFLAQLTILINPRGQKAKDLLIGKGEDWRDRTHFKSAYGLAWADWIFMFPIFIAGSVGVILGTSWGYILWAIAGGISVYINVMLWFMEKEYVYPSCGALAYYTYYWGNFVYWGILAIGYSIFRLNGISI